MSDDLSKKLQNTLGRMNAMPSIPMPILPEIDHAAIARNRNELAGRYDAEGIFEHLQSQISDFQRTMDDEHEIGVQLANFGISAEIHVRSIGYKNPNLIEFVGLLADGKKVKLVQHISQLNFLLISVPPITDEEPYRIGFGK